MNYEEQFRGYDVPEDLKKTVTAILMRFSINGICDGMHIANVIANQNNMGDGAGHFNGEMHCINDKTAEFLQVQYGCNIRKEDIPELKEILKYGKINPLKATHGINDSDQGYQGELYVCKDEFLGAEFLDGEYIKSLLDNEALYAEYETIVDRTVYPMLSSCVDVEHFNRMKVDFPEMLDTWEKECREYDVMTDEEVGECGENLTRFQQAVFGADGLLEEYLDEIGETTGDDMTEMIEMTVFCDSTELFTEDECNIDNLAYIDFPKKIVKKYFDELCDSGQLDGLQINGHDITFDEWLDEYTAEDTDDLYDFAVAEGYHPRRFGKGERPKTVYFRGQDCYLCFFEDAKNGVIINRTMNIGDFHDHEGDEYFYNCTLDEDGFWVGLWYEDETLEEAQLADGTVDPLSEEERKFLEILMRSVFDCWNKPERAAA